MTLPLEFMEWTSTVACEDHITMSWNTNASDVDSDVGPDQASAWRNADDARPR